MKTLKKYPYIQEFIDFLNEKHKLTSNEEEFIKCMKDYLGEFIASNKYEINHYIQSHYYNKEKPCMVNRATFFNALKYMLEKYEKSVECYDNVQAIREDKGEYEEIELFQSFVIFSPKGQFELNSYVGKVIGKDINVKESYNNSEMDIDFFINNLVLQSTKMLENFVVLKYFAYRMYELTKEKEKIETSDVELILADIINEYKRVRGRNSN